MGRAESMTFPFSKFAFACFFGDNCCRPCYFGDEPRNAINAMKPGMDVCQNLEGSKFFPCKIFPLEYDFSSVGVSNVFSFSPLRKMIQFDSCVRLNFEPPISFLLKMLQLSCG